MRVRLAGVSDLIAAEGKYHKKCLNAYKYNTSKTQQQTKYTDLAMIFLCKELSYAAEKNQVLQMSDVWQRYEELAKETGTEIPQSFISRRTSFKEKLLEHVGSHYEFVQPLQRSKFEREPLLVPHKYCHDILAEQHYSSVNVDELLTIPNYQPQEDTFLSMLHIALKIRGDIVAHPGHKGFDVSEDAAIECVPDSLYMFLNVLLGGQKLLEDDDDIHSKKIQKRQTQILSIAQDVVYAVSEGSKWTPKHIGLGSTLHQVTRSKMLVELFHRAGHILSYKQILKLDTSLAENTLKSMNEENGAVVPPNLSPGTFTHFTADNIDINDSTLDGKNTFHATQVAAWQRGPAADAKLSELRPSAKTTLQIPESMERLFPVNIVEGESIPVFTEPVKLDWYTVQEDACDIAQEARAIDLTFLEVHQGNEVRQSWSAFNQSISKKSDEITTVGYMPIIQAPAHELDTLNTVVRRCMYISTQLGQEYTVLTVDQALYYKLMELKWCIPEYKDKLIPRLGGLHISMNFLKVIGQHTSDSGLLEAWVEAGILGRNTAEHAMAGKAYNKAMRSHKLTFQALWRLILPTLKEFIQEKDDGLHLKITTLSQDDKTDELIATLKTDKFQILMNKFAKERKSKNVNFTFWWQYLDVVSTLLMFTRAQRNGLWDLHLYSFRCMLPYFMRYDHNNYAKWGPIYLAEMHQLPREVLEEFQKGNFVVKRSAADFNQVSPDQAQEWLNATGKKGGGIVGITKTPSALSRWAMSYNLRSHIAAETSVMFDLNVDDSLVHKERLKGRQKLDNASENELYSTLKRFSVFSVPNDKTLQNIATKDLATDEIQKSLIDALNLGHSQMEEFVRERLIADPPKTKFRDPIRRNSPRTFSSLYEVKKVGAISEKHKVMNADRSLLYRLVTAYEAGRQVDMQAILRHELMPVPVSLAEMNGTLRTGNKSMLADVLTEEVDCLNSLTLEGRSALVIDGFALVAAIGKPDKAKTFGDLSDSFIGAVFAKAGSAFERVDVLFDRYRKMSIKACTRARRSKNTRSVRRVIEGRDVPLPSNWSSFLALGENKADLARFLSEELISQAPPQKIVIASGGFIDEEEVHCSDSTVNVEALQSTHEEADTRFVLHAIHHNGKVDNVVISARDTDVLLLLLAHKERITSKVWLWAGTSKKPKYIPLENVFNNLPPSSQHALLQFHAITGCDTTSYLCGHSKKTAWKVFQEHFELLLPLGEGVLEIDKLKCAEKFVCKIYKTESDSTDMVRFILFGKVGAPDKLPPTSDALKHHVMRAHYQALIWRQAHVANPNLPKPEESGWIIKDDQLEPILMTLDPIPKACVELISCNCKTGCATQRCKCRKSKIVCTGLCGCKKSSINVCINVD